MAAPTPLTDFAGFVGSLVITYGSFHLRFSNLPADPHGARAAVREFALGMLRWLVLGAGYATYQAVVETARGVFWVGLVVREGGAGPMLITGGR